MGSLRCRQWPQRRKARRKRKMSQMTDLSRVLSRLAVKLAKNRTRGRRSARARRTTSHADHIGEEVVAHDLELAASLRTPLSSNLGKMPISRID